MISFNLHVAKVLLHNDNLNLRSFFKLWLFILIDTTKFLDYDRYSWPFQLACSKRYYCMTKVCNIPPRHFFCDLNTAYKCYMNYITAWHVISITFWVFYFHFLTAGYWTNHHVHHRSRLITFRLSRCRSIAYLHATLLIYYHLHPLVYRPSYALS